MSRIRSKNTTPELLVRGTVHKLGYRFRLHKSDLPGCPDLVLSRHKKIIFIHGCFWHMHNCRYGRIRPKSNQSYWETKLKSNAKRDNQNIYKLKRKGWKVLVIWECWMKDIPALESRVYRFLIDDK